MFKKTLKSKKSSINRDTLLIVQVFVLILLVFLIINQVDTFKNNKTTHKHNEGFVDNQTDTVKLHINNSDTDPNHIVRLGDLTNILNDDDIFSTNFNINTLTTYNLFEETTNNKTSDYFRTNSVTHITIANGYSAILYDGNNFDNNKRSILINGNNNKINLKDYDFKNKLSSIKVFETDNNTDVLKREANFNNQILLLSKEDKQGEISRINLPTEKMTKELEIEYFYTIDSDSDNPIKPIYHIVIPGSHNTQTNRNGVYRNINLTLYNSKKNIVGNPITKNTDYEETTTLKNITDYKITPLLPTLDTFTALNILKNNRDELESLKSELENIKNDQIKKNVDTQTNQTYVKNELANSFITKIQTQNNKYNYKLYKHGP